MDLETLKRQLDTSHPDALEYRGQKGDDRSGKILCKRAARRRRDLPVTIQFYRDLKSDREDITLCLDDKNAAKFAKLVLSNIRMTAKDAREVVELILGSAELGETDRLDLIETIAAQKQRKSKMKS